jgi:PmbA protein
MMSDLLDVADEAVRRALPGEDLEAFVIHRVGTTVRVDADGDVEDLHQREVSGLGVRLLKGHRLGYASTTDLSPGAIARVVELARRSTSFTADDQAQRLPLPTGEAARLDGALHSDLDRTPVDKKIAAAARGARQVAQAHPLIRAIDTFELADERRTVAVVSSTGIRSYDERGHIEAYCDAIADDGETRSADFGWAFGRSLDELDLDALAASAAARATRLLGPPAKKPHGVPVVMDPAVVADLVLPIGRALSGGPMSSGRTPFADRMGDTIGSAAVTICEAGRDLRAPLSGRYDDEGVPRQDITLVRAGMLVAALHSTVTAAAVGGGTRSTGNAIRASHRSPPRAAATSLLFEPTTTLADIARHTPMAVYVQEISGAGSGINPVTGQVDLGARGWLWHDGEPAGRLENLLISTTLPRLLAAIQAVGDDCSFVPGAGLGATLVFEPGLVT